MSRIYDNWERLVGAVLRREEDRQLALCESVSSSSSADVSSRFSSSFNPFVGDVRNEYEELKKATKNFHPCMLLAEGAIGRVYKGWVHEHYLTVTKPVCGIAVAIEKMNLEGYQENNRESLDKIHYLSELRHPNLVKLVGYSFNADNRILVYEFMRNGSLDDYLFRRGRHSLNWATRVKVAIGAARAIAFLHEVSAIYQHIKSSVILLDGDFNAKLSGFGLARNGPAGDWTHVTIRVLGRDGYDAPEYVATGHFSMTCDVYSFGAVLLELISGFRMFDFWLPVGKPNLLDWAKPNLNDKSRLSRIVDSRLEGKYPSKEAYKVAQISLRCLSVEPRLRPKMSEVVDVLENL